jgi:hypothetical protein
LREKIKRGREKGGRMLNKKEERGKKEKIV